MLPGPMPGPFRVIGICWPCLLTLLQMSFGDAVGFRGLALGGPRWSHSSQDSCSPPPPQVQKATEISSSRATGAAGLPSSSSLEEGPCPDHKSPAPLHPAPKLALVPAAAPRQVALLLRTRTELCKFGTPQPAATAKAPSGVPPSAPSACHQEASASLRASLLASLDSSARLAALGPPAALPDIATPSSDSLPCAGDRR